ncbi:MAG: ribosome maturation factor RimM [Bacteroidales bacterium]|jgi:16S rRNA processing protein RimM|nr:ribosome maturation factor RimM [Bacteroidales bacterium]
MVFDNKNLILIGFIRKPYKFNGFLNVVILEEFSSEIFNKDEPVFLNINGIPVPFFIEDIKVRNNNLAVKFKHIDSEYEAENYKNTELFLDEKYLYTFREEADLELDDDFVGFEVYDKKFGFIGKVTELNLIPGNPVIETDFNGKNLVLPFAENFVENIDYEQEKIFLTTPDGLIEIFL